MAKAGERNTRVRVERHRSGAQLTAGGQLDESKPGSWETATEIGRNGELWVALRATGSREFTRGKQVVVGTTYQAEFDYSSALRLTAGMRCRIGSRILNIDGPPINVDERSQTLQCSCIEEPPA